MRGYIESVNLIRNRALSIGTRSGFSDELAVGEGWYRVDVRIAIIFVVGTGTTAIAEGELQFVKNVTLRSDRGEYIANIPGRALYKIAHTKTGAAPDKDAIAAASATYMVNLPIYFCEHERLGFPRPEDTILDTKRYSSLTLEVQLGTVADLLTTVGTSSVTAALDLDVVRTKGPLPQDAKGNDLVRPMGYTYHDVRPPVDASTLTSILLERAADLLVRRYYLFSVTGGTTGVPFSGVASNAIVDIFSIKDQSGYVYKDRIFRMIQNDNKNYFSIEAWPVGLIVIDFVQDRSMQSALITAGKSLLNATWSNQGSPGAGSLVSCVTEGIRRLN
jgi:hypothetical protein